MTVLGNSYQSYRSFSKYLSEQAATNLGILQQVEERLPPAADADAGSKKSYKIKFPKAG